MNSLPSVPSRLPRSLVGCLLSVLAVTIVHSQTTAPVVEDADDTVLNLPTFEVSFQKDVGYAATHSLGASRMNVDLRDSPLSVVTLNEALLRDLAPTDIMAAMQYVSSMAQNGTGVEEIYSLRGVVVQGSQRDGLPEPGGPNLGVNNAIIDPAFYDRVEVIKGPAGTIYGSHDLGGVINRVSKAAVFERSFTSLQATVGSFDMKRVVLDSNQAFSGDRGALRATALYQDAEVLTRGDPNDRLAAQLSVAWKLVGGGKAWLTGYLGDNETMVGTAPWFIDAAGNISTRFDRRFSYNQNDARNEDTRTLLEAGLQRPVDLFGTSWNLRFVTRYSKLEFADRLYNPRAVAFFNSAGAAIPGGTLASAWSDVRITAWTVRDQDETLYYRGGFIDLAGDFTTGPLRHTVLTSLQLQNREKFTRRVTNGWKAMSYLFPVYEPNPEAFRTSATSAVAIDSTTNQDAFAWSVQDNISLMEGRLNVILGARYDNIADDQADRRNNVFFNDRRNTNWLFNYGLTFDATDWLTFYAQHGETYQARGGLDGLGNSIPNEEGSVDEVGFKVSAFEGRLTSTTAFFDMEQRNILVQTFIPALNVALLIPAGNITVQGWETDIRYQPVTGLNLLVAAGNLDSRTSAGTLPRNTPQKLNYQFFGKYDFQGGALKGFGIGTGYIFTSERAVEGNPNLLLPGNHEWNGVLTYETGPWRLHLAVNNIDDNRAAKGSNLNARIMPVPPRSFRLSTTYSF